MEPLGKLLDGLRCFPAWKSVCGDGVLVWVLGSKGALQSIQKDGFVMGAYRKMALVVSSISCTSSLNPRSKPLRKALNAEHTAFPAVGKRSEQKKHTNSTWVVAKIIVPFLCYSTAPIGDHNFENHPHGAP